MNSLPESLIHFWPIVHSLLTSTRLVFLPPGYDKLSIEIPTPFSPEFCGECPPVASFFTIEVSIVPLALHLPVYFIHEFSTAPPVLAISQLDELTPKSYDPKNYISVRL